MRMDCCELVLLVVNADSFRFHFKCTHFANSRFCRRKRRLTTSMLSADG